MEVDTLTQKDGSAGNAPEHTNTTDACFKMPSNAQQTGKSAAKSDDATPPNGGGRQNVNAPTDVDDTPPTAIGSTTTPAIQRLRQSRLEFKINSPSDALASPDVNQLMRSKLKHKPQGGATTISAPSHPLLRKE